MEVVLKKYGNSTVAVMPPAVLRDLGIKVGQTMSLETTPEGSIVLSPKRRFTLAELLSQCNAKAPPPADMALWDNAKPVGNEAW